MNSSPFTLILADCLCRLWVERDRELEEDETETLGKKKNSRDERAEDDCSASIGALEFSDEVVVRLEFGFVLTNPNL